MLTHDTPLQLATSRYAARDLILASGLAPVAISLGLPNWPLEYEIAGHLLELAPTPRIFHLPRPAFERAYRRQLDELELDALEAKLRALADASAKRGAVLLCFEDLAKDDSWCHRRLFADHWQARIGRQVLELGS